MSYFKTIWGKISDTIARPMRVDSSTHSLQVIDYGHHEEHSGSAYRVFCNKDVANSAGTYNFAFTTPDTDKHIHFTLAVAHELEGHFTLFENITSFTGGTAITHTLATELDRFIANANRNSGNLSGVEDMELDTTPTLGTAYSILIDEHGGSGKKFGAASDHNAEWILKRNTTYYGLFTNNATAANETNFEMDWYEHTPKG